MEALEINERIAGIKGFNYKIICGRAHVWPGTSTHNQVYDYITDNNLNHGLVVELLLAEWHPKYSKDDEYHRWFGRYQYAEVEHKDFNTATCLAYIEEFGND